MRGVFSDCELSGIDLIYFDTTAESRQDRSLYSPVNTVKIDNFHLFLHQVTCSVKLNKQFAIVDHMHLIREWELISSMHDGAMTRGQFNNELFQTFFKFELFSRKKIIEETNLARWSFQHFWSFLMLCTSRQWYSEEWTTKPMVGSLQKILYCL